MWRHSFSHFHWLVLLVIGGVAQAQPYHLPLDSAIAIACRESPLLRQRMAEVQEQQALRRGAFSIPNPNVIVESPTGEFYTLGVTQEFALPMVYLRQGQVARAQVQLANAGLRTSEVLVRREVRLSYLALQSSEAQLRLLAQEDSVFRRLAEASGRLYASGEIDLLQRVSTEAEASQARNRLQEGTLTLAAAQARLALLLGRPEVRYQSDGDFFAIAADTLGLTASSDLLNANPELGQAAQSRAVAEQQLRLERARALPNFLIGYQNQGVRESEVQYRFQAGLSVPLYFWNARSSIRAAQARTSAASAAEATLALDVRREAERLQAEIRKGQNSLRYYQQTGLPQAETIVATAERLFAAGETNYVLLLQSLRQAFQIRREQLDALLRYREAVIQYQSLTGQ